MIIFPHQWYFPHFFAAHVVTESGASFNEERAEPDRSPPWQAIRGISDMKPPTPAAEEEEHLSVHIIHN